MADNKGLAFDDLTKAFAKAYGETVMQKGFLEFTAERIPTGAFPFDLATGGGFPQGRVSVIYGPESSMKTTSTLMAIGNAQRMFPDKTAVFVDAENSLDKSWAQHFCDVDKLGYVIPQNAEQAVDIVTDLVYATDVSIVVLDSVAALVSGAEIEKDASATIVGKSGNNAGRLYKKLTAALIQQRLQQVYPTIILINQIRYKIGVLMGDPETLPGGQSFKYCSALTVRISGKDAADPKIHPAMPYAKIIKGVIKKQKVGINARSFEFTVPCLNIPDKSIQIGKVDCFSTIKAYLTQLDQWDKDKGGWKILDEVYKTQDEFRMAMRQDPGFEQYVHGKIFHMVGEKGGVL